MIVITIDDYFKKVLIDNKSKKAFARGAIVKVINILIFINFPF